MKHPFFNRVLWLLIPLLTLSIPKAWGTTYTMTMDQNAKGNNNVHVTESTSPASKTYNAVTWSIAWAGKGSPTSGSKSQVQFGTASNPCSSVTISTSGISGTISSVSVTCSGASSNDATVSISVGGTAFKNGNNTSLSVGTTLNAKTFSGSASGTIEISISQSTSKALYVSAVSVTYTSCTNLGTINGSINCSHTETSSTVTVEVLTAGVNAYGDAANVSGYEFKLYNASSGGSQVGSGSTNSSSGTSYEFTGLSASTNYWFTVRPIGDGTTYCNTTAESSRVQVTTAAAGAKSYCLEVFNSDANTSSPRPTFTSISANEYTLSYTIPGKSGSNWPQYWVGENDAWSSSFSANANFADMNLVKSTSGTIGLAAGATGTLHIWDDNIQSGTNLYIKFDPDGYGISFGPTSGDWTTLAFSSVSSTVYETAIQELTTTQMTTWKYWVGFQSASGYVYSGVDNEGSDNRGSSRNYEMNNMRVRSNASDFKGTRLGSEAAAVRGKFRIWVDNSSEYNFYCHFVPYHRVVFNANYPADAGDSPAPQYSVDVSVEETNSSIALASAPTAPTGYTFDGWYDAADGGTKVTTARTISAGATADIQLYAHWTPISYTLTWNLDGGEITSAGTAAGSVAYGTALTAPTVSKTGHTFAGWSPSVPATMPASNATYTATWTPINYSVTWYAGGTAAGNITTAGGPTTSVAYGSKVTTLPTNPDGSACDKTFVGWTNTTTYTHGTSVLFTDAAGSPAITGATSFYAVFAEVSGGTDYEQVTSLDDIHDGPAYFAYYGSYSGSRWYGVNSVSTITAPVTVSEGVLTTSTDDYTLTEFTIVTVDAANHIYYIKIGDDYVIGSSSSSNTDLSLDDAPYAWTFESINSTTYNMQISHTYTTPSTTCYMKAGVGTATGGKFRSYPTTGQQISLFQTTESVTGHTITCADCGTSVTPTFTAAPTGGTVAVTKSGSAVTSGSTVKTCTATDLSVTITPASHYTLTGFTASGLTEGTATISPAVASTLPATTATTFTVTVSAAATGTLNLTPTFTEDTHIAITWSVNGSPISPEAAEGLTWVYSGGSITALPDASLRPVPAGCSGTKVFAGWSTKHSDATEEDASYYDDLFTAAGPTSITSAQTYYAVFATSSSNLLAGQTMWAEDWDGASNGSTPSGTTGYSSTSISYAYTNGGSDTKVYAGDDQHYAGGSSPELLIGKSTGVFDVTNIPTAGQTELTLTYKANKAFGVSSGTSGVTVGDANVDGTTYTRTITISQSPAVNNFALSFTNTNSGNGRLDDISLVVPGSGTMSDYVTTCAPSYTITYNKNTEDAVTNLPSPTSVLQSTGSGTLSSTEPSRATYTFSGWAETTSGAVAYAAGGSITGVTGDKTLYAVWTKTPVEEINLNYYLLNKYVGDASVTLEVTSVSPDGADMSVTWSSSNSSIAPVVAATGVVSFSAVGTATITATSTVTGTTYATCAVTVRNKPTATFVDLIHGGNGTDLDDYALQDVAGTSIVFPTLSNTTAGAETCDDQHYIFVGWTTSDNNTDPEDDLVTVDELEDDVAKTFYAVWADGVAGVSYTKLTSADFKGSPTKYVLGAEKSTTDATTYYFYTYGSADSDLSWGTCSSDPTTNAPIQFTLSGTASALVAQDASGNYLQSRTSAKFRMSSTSTTVVLKDNGDIYDSGNSYRMRYNYNNGSGGLRWYNSDYNTPANFYEVVTGTKPSYRTSCCTNNVAAPTVTATNTAYTVTLTWAAVADATGYEVSWNGGAWTAATSPVNKTSLTASTTYTYKVRATYDPLAKCGALVAAGSVTTDDVYTVTYSGGTGTGSCSPTGSVASATYEAGQTVTLAATNSYSLTSNTFAAWVVKDADNNEVTVTNNQFTMPASNVTVTATWTAVRDKYYDRMHQSTSAAQGGVADGDGKYYLVREGCNYTVPSPADDATGDTDCHTTHYKLLGWIAYSHLKTDGSGEIKTGEESYIFQGGTVKSATGATYYAIYAIMTE